MSPPVWGRGLKLFTLAALLLMFIVAPRAGAWIETTQSMRTENVSESPPAWGRGLKQWVALIQ